MLKKSYILILILLVPSCITKAKSYQKLEIWENVLNAVKNENVNYLLEISSDSLKCIECNNGRDWVKKEVFFENHLNQMRLGEEKKYSYFKEDVIEKNSQFTEKFRVIYSKQNKGNKYEIVYTLLQGDNKIKFLGVYSIP